jgi:hypothetical protein
MKKIAHLVRIFSLPSQYTMLIKNQRLYSLALKDNNMHANYKRTVLC